MENPGEHLVGQYLREIRECDFVEYNLQTKKKQGEIDVVGINSSKRVVYVCEVATHLGGLRYTKDGKGDNVKRFVEKFSKNIQYVKDNFKGYEAVYMLWSPIIKQAVKKENAIVNQLRDINEVKEKMLTKRNVEIELVYNEKYLACINELRKKACQTTQAMTSPIMRFLQIEEKLKQHCTTGKGIIKVIETLT